VRGRDGAGELGVQRNKLLLMLAELQSNLPVADIHTPQKDQAPSFCKLARNMVHATFMG
jgi:hypothetical protein